MTTLPVSIALDHTNQTAGAQAAASFGELVQRIVQSNSGKHKALVPVPRRVKDSWEHYCRKAEEANVVGNFAHVGAMWLKAIAETHYFDVRDWRRAYSLDRLASLYFAQGRYDEAEVFASRSLEAATISYGYESEKTADCEDFLASIYFNLGRLDEAAAHAKQAIALFEKLRGEENARVASVCYNLGMIYHSCGAFDQAETYYQRAFRIRSKVFGWDHEATTKISKSYSELALDRKYHEEAKQIIDRLIGPVTE
jgi:Tetratricopeptide repeat.